MRSTSPTDMTAAERLSELTDILGAGVQRMFSHEIKQIPNTQKQQVPLAAEGLLKAACDSRVLNPKSQEPAA